MSQKWTRRDIVKIGAAATATLLKQSVSKAATAIAVVRDNTSKHVIVRRAKASASEVYAAEELQRWVREMTGATLRVLGDDLPLPAKAILLGDTRHTSLLLGSPTDISMLGDDGFRLVARPPHFIVLGSAIRGTLYGVYELLEKFGGCRWYSTFHTVVPRRTGWELPEIDQTHVPAFAMRESFWIDMFDGDFAARNRVNGNAMRLEAKHGGKIRFGGQSFVHTAYMLLPPSEFFHAHPEYYAQVGGKRLSHHSQLCWTNPDVTRIITERVLKAVRQDPLANLFSVSQNDYGANCECKNCREVDDREGTAAGSLLTCINQVADAVADQFPNIWIETLAFQHTRKPPRNMRPSNNVVPRLCSIECDFSRPLNDSIDQQDISYTNDIRGWSAITNKLFIWDYVTNFTRIVGPYPNFGALQGNIQLFRKYRARGVFEQGASVGPHAEFAELRAWLIAKLLWNPNANVNHLLDDFFAGYYGAAAEPVRTYFDELQALVDSPEQKVFIGLTMNAPFYSDSFFKRAQMLFDDAEHRVKNDSSALYRVKMTAIPVLFARAERWRPMKLRRIVTDSLLKLEGVDTEYFDLATELRTRLEGSQVRVSESTEIHNAFMATLRDRTVSVPLTTISNSRIVSAVSGTLGAKALSLKLDDREYLDAALGGVDMKAGCFLFDSTDEVAWKQNESSNHKATFLSDSGELRCFDATERALRLTGKFHPQASECLYRAALILGTGETVAIAADHENSSRLTVPSNQLFATWSIKPARNITISSPISGHAATLTFPDVPPDRVVILCDTQNSAVRVFAAFMKSKRNNPDSNTHTVELLPNAHAKSVSPLRVGNSHEARRIVVDDCFFQLARPGVWGALERDPYADDGFAMKLYNTHFEWCLQWWIRPELFIPGAKYRTRALVRVAKREILGRAFWAGVYDVDHKKSLGDIAPLTSEVKEGYHWYDLASYQPESNQYVWVGPGPWEAKYGGKSAILALYVKRLEFVMIT